MLFRSIENLEELVTATRQFSYNEEDEDLMPLQAFLSHAALEAGEGQADTWQDAVQLMTLHSAKGLEFPQVFICLLYTSEVASALNDRAVVDYLLQHPEFFIRNAAQVEHLRVPHPVRGTISLVEWHMMRARNHIHVLEENMSLLMEQAVANESPVSYTHLRDFGWPAG